jgi:hypothetical protein
MTTDLSFSQRCQDEDCLFDPPVERIFDWFEKLFTVDLVSKPLNQKALESMQKKGVIPGKQFSDLHVKVIIVNSTDAVHLAFQGDADLIDACSAPVDNGTLSINTANFKVYTCPSAQAFKDRDVYMTLIFNEIKKLYPSFFVEDD